MTKLCPQNWYPTVSLKNLPLPKHYHHTGRQIHFPLDSLLHYRASLHIKLCHEDSTCRAQEATSHILPFLPPNSRTVPISLLPPLIQKPNFFHNYSDPFPCPNFLALNRQTSVMLNNILQNYNKKRNRRHLWEKNKWVFERAKSVFLHSWGASNAQTT